MTEEQKIKISLLYMYTDVPIVDFLKDCEIFIVKKEYPVFRNIPPDVKFTFQVPAPTYKKYDAKLEIFQAKLKTGLHKLHGYDSVLVYLTADWDNLEITSTEVKPVLTPWQEINTMQDTLLEQIHTASEENAFRNVGNTARHLLMKLADIVFEEEKHTAPDNKKDLRKDKYNNRLWAFVLYKVPASSSGDKVRKYAHSLLETCEKAIDLSNSVTHALNANAFLARSCLVSTLTAVHFIKLVYELRDPI